MTNSKMIMDLFQSGRYLDVINLWAHAKSSSDFNDKLNGTLVLGSLCLLGRRWEAEEFPASQTNPFGRNFFLGVSLVRESLYSEAERIFDKNSKSLNASHHDLDVFFVHQGIGFFSFFNGETATTLVSAEKAYRAALRSQFTWGQAMALDLVSHGLFHQGKVQESLETFGQVIELARSMKAEDLANSFEVSRACYESQISCEPLESLHRLKQLEKKLKPHDLFSKNTLALEVFRQLVHAGRFEEAKILFEKISPSIYAAKNRRQISNLIFRYAHLLSLQGSDSECLALLRSNRVHLIEGVDRVHLLKSLSLEKNILSKNSKADKQTLIEIEKKIEDLYSFVSSFVPRRMKNRRDPRILTPFQQGQDPLGDLLDKANKKPFETMKDMIEHKLWGLVGPAMGWSPASRLLILNASGDYALVFENSRCRLSDKPLRGIPRKILELLREHVHVTKSVIIESIWKYEYESDRHDPLIQSSLRQLRLQLGGTGEYISMTPKGYKLNIAVLNWSPQIKALEAPLPSPSLSTPISTNDFSLPPSLSHLNSRQIHFLRTRMPEPSITIRDYCKKFKISHMTAFRDLKQLADEKFLQRVGKGRATCYLRT